MCSVSFAMGSSWIYPACLGAVFDAALSHALAESRKQVRGPRLKETGVPSSAKLEETMCIMVVEPVSTRSHLRGTKLRLTTCSIALA